ncbi:MAG: peroxiredoxin [Dokdonella sp.]
MKRLSLLLMSFLFAFATPLWASKPDLGPEAGQAAPNFKLQDQNGKTHALADFKDGYLVLYFYPKDFTGGCTTQVCAFRDDIRALKKAGASVVGVSLDDVKSHAEFAEKYRVPFPLLADAKHDTARDYGVLAIKEGFGDYARRETFLIGPDGKVIKRYRDVDPEKNVKQVLADLAEKKGDA